MSFFYNVFTLTHGLQFKNELTQDPIWPYWKDFQTRAADAYNKWYKYWFKMAEESNIPIYFFRFEDVIHNPGKELKEIFRFILGLETIEGTVIEHRIDEVMSWSKEKNQSYKPRQGGTNKNLKNYT